MHYIPLYLYFSFYFIGIYTILFYYSSNHTHVLTVHIALSDPSNELEENNPESANCLIKLYVSRWHQSLQQNLLVDTNHCRSACLCTECQTPLFNKTLISFRSFCFWLPLLQTHVHTLIVYLPAKNEMQDSGFSICLVLTVAVNCSQGQLTESVTNMLTPLMEERFRAKSKNRKDSR